MLSLFLQLLISALMIAYSWNIYANFLKFKDHYIYEQLDDDLSSMRRIRIITDAARPADIHFAGFCLFFAISLWLGLYVLALGWLYKAVELLIKQNMYKLNKNCTLFLSANVVFD